MAVLPARHLLLACLLVITSFTTSSLASSSSLAASTSSTSSTSTWSPSSSHSSSPRHHLITPRSFTVTSCLPSFGDGCVHNDNNGNGETDTLSPPSRFDEQSLFEDVVTHLTHLTHSRSPGAAFLHQALKVRGGSNIPAHPTRPGHPTHPAHPNDERSHSSCNPNQPGESNPLVPTLAIRGGDSSDSADSSMATKLRNVIRSILDSPSLPSPIQQWIEKLFQFLEGVTGWKILPRVEKESGGRKSKGRKQPQRDGRRSGRSKKKVLVEEAEEVSVGKTGRRKKKGRSMSGEDDDGEEEMSESSKVATKKKKRKSTSSSASSSSTKSEPSKKSKPSSSKTTPQAESTPSKSTTTTTPTSTTASSTTPTSTTKPRPDAASKKFLSNTLKSTNPNYRIQRELKSFLSSPPPNLSVKISGKNVRLWIITLHMPPNTIYANETYKLRVQFPNDYPTSPPSVYFLPPTPRHEHVYTNGDICLSLLGKDWRPIMTAQSLAQAIMSILCGAQRKSLPMDNSRHAGNKPGQRQDDWVYHDDNC